MTDHDIVAGVVAVNAEGALPGIVSFDDLLPLVAQEFVDLAKLPLVGRKQECEFRH